MDPQIPEWEIHATHGHHDLEDHRTNRAGWLRAAVLGANDGILSTAALLAGMVGSGAGFDTVRTAGIAGMVAGAMSMAAGEYVSVSSQRDVEEADLALEAEALELHPGAELAELTEIWRSRGLEPELAAEVAVQLTQTDALAAHARDELGITEVAAARPLQAAVTSFLAFCLGAALPILSYVLAPADARYLVVTGGALVFLALLGAVGAALGAAPRIPAMARVAIGGAVAMTATTLIGELTGSALG